MPTRLPVAKTWKLFIGGAFPRSESGRTRVLRTPTGRVIGHVSEASRKDLRDAVEAARKAAPGWAGRTGYNRGQILYRLAEMLEARAEEFVGLLRADRPAAELNAAAARREVSASVDRLVSFAGWCDKLPAVLGCLNDVAHPHHVVTTPEPMGVLGVVCPDEPGLLGAITLLAPVLATGGTAVVLGSPAHPLPGLALGELCATADVPGGVVNLLTAHEDPGRGELHDVLADHRGVDGILAANVPAEVARRLELGAAENLKRVRIETFAEDDWTDPSIAHAPWRIEPLMEMKTIWHPSAT